MLKVDTNLMSKTLRILLTEPIVKKRTNHQVSKAKVSSVNAHTEEVSPCLTQ